MQIPLAIEATSTGPQPSRVLQLPAAFEPLQQVPCTLQHTVRGTGQVRALVQAEVSDDEVTWSEFGMPLQVAGLRLVSLTTTTVFLSPFVRLNVLEIDGDTALTSILKRGLR